MNTSQDNLSLLDNNSSHSKIRVAIVYDRVNKWGGAERVLLALHKIFPDAPLYTSVYNAQNAQWAKSFSVTPSFLQSIPYARDHHEFFAPLMPIVFESFSFDEYDLVISVTSEAAKGILTKTGTKHICICLTPTRYLWSGYEEYFKNSLFRVITRPLVSYLRKWDTMAAQRPDQIIAISETVQDRIKTYYDRDSLVIYPPATLSLARRTGPQTESLVTSSWSMEKTKQSKKSINHEPRTMNQERENSYFLIVSRLSKLTAYKRVDLAIKAANTLKVPLKVVGTGRDFDYYKQMAGETVEFVGEVSDNKLSEYYQQCKALIFPGVEDFGLVMVEAQAHGKPVIAYRAGGAMEIVREGKTGEFFNKQTVESLIDVLKSFDITVYNKNECIKNSKRFSFEVFEKEMRKLIK